MCIVHARDIGMPQFVRRSWGSRIVCREGIARIEFAADDDAAAQYDVVGLDWKMEGVLMAGVFAPSCHWLEKGQCYCYCLRACILLLASAAAASAAASAPDWTRGCGVAEAVATAAKIILESQNFERTTRTRPLLLVLMPPSHHPPIPMPLGRRMARS